MSTSRFDKLTPDEIRDMIDAVHAYDGGATDSGIKDDEFKVWFMARPDHEKLLVKYLIDLISLEGYDTIDQAREFIEWADELMCDFWKPEAKP